MKKVLLLCVLLVATAGWALGNEGDATLADAYSDALTADSSDSSSISHSSPSSLSVVGRTTPHPHSLEAAPASLAETSTTTFTSRTAATDKQRGIGDFLKKKAKQLIGFLRKRRSHAKAYGERRNRRNSFVNRGRKVGRGLMNGGGQGQGEGHGSIANFARAFNQPIVVPLPKSQFGIPSELDEECVVCQYFVQRIQGKIYEKIVTSNLGRDNSVFGGSPALNTAAIAQAALNANLAKTGVPDAAGAAAQPGGAVPGIPRMGALASNIPVPAVMSAASAGGPFAGGPDTGAAVGAQQALLIKKTNSKLRRLPGGRGIVRVIAEDVTRSVCHTDRMPELFYPYCQRFKSRGIWRAVKKGLFFNFPVASVCYEAGMCGTRSYIAGKGAVHMPKSSAKYNSYRGLCGLRGGLHERNRVKELYCQRPTN